MSNDREALEDKFNEADSQQEIAFDHYQRAVKRNSGPIMAAALRRGGVLHRELVRLAAKLSKRETRK